MFETTERRSQPITTSSEWNFELIQKFDQVIGKIAKSYGLDTYPNQIEIISSEQMMDAYSSVGMPVGYHHWSFGKQFLQTQGNYERGYMGLAYEIVINSNPCIAYLMEENTMAMQALVIAHAAYGHNSFFKNNYLFKRLLWAAFFNYITSEIHSNENNIYIIHYCAFCFYISISNAY